MRCDALQLQCRQRYDTRRRQWYAVGLEDGWEVGLVRHYAVGTKRVYAMAWLLARAAAPALRGRGKLASVGSQPSLHSIAASFYRARSLPSSTSSASSSSFTSYWHLCGQLLFSAVWSTAHACTPRRQEQDAGPPRAASTCSSTLNRAVWVGGWPDSEWALGSFCSGGWTSAVILHFSLHSCTATTAYYGQGHTTSTAYLKAVSIRRLALDRTNLIVE